jgi:O-antigen ligase
MLLWSAAGLAAMVAVIVGLAAHGGSRTAVVLVLAAAVGAAVLVLALTRFSAYVLLMLGIRSCVDLFKVSAKSAGVAGGASGRITDPSTLLAILFLITAGLWLAARCRARMVARTSPLGIALLVMSATVLISALGSRYRSDSLLESLRILTVVVMFVVLEQLMPDRRSIRVVLLAVYASLALALAYTIGMSLLGSPPSEVKGSFTRISGPFSQSTTFGRYLMFMVIFGFGLYRFLDRRRRLLLALLLVPSLGFLVLTNTRGAIIGTALGLVVVALLHRSVRLIATLCVVAVLTVALVPAVSQRFAELGTSRAVGGAPTGNTLAWRLSYWSEVIQLANRNPVTGIGPDVTQHETDQAKQPHNDFLRAYVETGVLGLLAYLGVMLFCLVTARRALRRAPPGSLERGIAVGFAGCALAFIAVSAASNVISNVVTLWYFVAFAAAATAVAYRGATPKPSSIAPAPSTEES